MTMSAAMLDPTIGAGLIDAAGSDAFGPLLLDTANFISNVDEIFAYRAAAGGTPSAILSVSKLDSAAARAENYVREFFRFDPVTTMRAQTGGETFVASVRANELSQQRYRALCFDGPRFAGKLCFGWRDRAGCIVISFYRCGSAELADKTHLLPLANVALSILAKERQTALPLIDRLEHRLAHRFPNLTSRERQVSARTIAGWSAEQSAADLGIRPTTVITYRQRAYQRLGFRSAHDFLGLLLH